MWIFTRHGYFSAVQNYKNRNLIHVRARFKGDLERLCLAYRIPPQVTSTPMSDYPYRMDFTRDAFAQIVKNEVEAIDYTNFTLAVHEGTKRDAAYGSVSRTLKNAQF